MGSLTSNNSSVTQEGAKSSGTGINEQETPRPLNVIISGAGIGGLMAAVALRENGHNVKIFEQSRFANEVGAAVVMAPNATASLRRYGFEPATCGAVTCERTTGLNRDGSLIYDSETSSIRETHCNPWQLIHRVDLHNKLKEMAVDPDRNGTPVEIHLSSRAVDVDTETATITLENGEKHEADVVIGADGVHSALRRAIVGDDYCEIEPSGKRAFRFLIPTEKLREDPETKIFVEYPGRLLIWIGQDRRIITYPCRNATLINCACICPDIAENETGTDWHNVAKLDELLESYKDFPSETLAFMRKMDPKELKVWRLLDLPKLKAWVSGRVALIGDAAHPFLPHHGQGAAQALEDGAALAVVLPLGTKPEEISERLKLYEEIRYERASTIQEYTRRTGEDITEGTPMIDVRQFTGFNFNYDPYDAATKHYNEYLLRKNPTLYKRLPISFGPFRDPRYDLHGFRRSTSKTSFMRGEVMIITPKPYLDTLLPSSEFSIDVPGTKAKVSFTWTKFSNIDWLGGKGYSRFEIYIHDVICKGKTEEVRGKFLLMSFENLAHPIMSGGEELGFSKLFATLEEDLSEEKFSLKARWKDIVFSSLEIAGLKEAGKDSATVNGENNEVGVLQYKYIPKTGVPGEVDVEYPTFSPHGSTVETKIEKTLTGDNASVTFDKKEWAKLPTLHHVVQGLERIRVAGILEAKVVVGSGLEDHAVPRRII